MLAHGQHPQAVFCPATVKLGRSSLVSTSPWSISAARVPDHNWNAGAEPDGVCKQQPGQYLSNFYGFRCGASTTIRFGDLGGPIDTQVNNVAVVLDNVSVAALPEPSTWAMMILGFVGLWFCSRSLSSSDCSVPSLISRARLRSAARPPEDGLFV